MSYPSTITVLTNPLATQKLNAPSHSGIETSQNTEITAVETFIGVEGSASTVGTLIYDVRSPASNGGGHVQTANKGGTGQTNFQKGDILTAQSSSVLSKLAVGGDGQILTADSTQQTGLRWGTGKFGGTGADGPLVSTSGPTVLNIGSVTTFTKNYSQISLTGTANLEFVSPNSRGTVIILKSQGDVTLTSTTIPNINASALGGIKGTGGISNGTQSGTDGTDGFSLYGTGPTGGGGAPVFANGTQGRAGSVAALTNIYNSSILSKYGAFFAVGGGGGGGGSGNNLGGPTTGGDGGNGGPVLIIECGGALNFTSANGISVKGGAGGNGSNGGAQVGGRGGSGGGGGTCLVLYNTLTTASGTITVAGGAGGTGGTGATGTATAGAGGGGGALTAGNIGNSQQTTPADGATGGNGFAILMKNTEFA